MFTELQCLKTTTFLESATDLFRDVEILALPFNVAGRHFLLPPSVFDENRDPQIKTSRCKMLVWKS